MDLLLVVLSDSVPRLCSPRVKSEIEILSSKYALHIVKERHERGYIDLADQLWLVELVCVQLT